MKKIVWRIFLLIIALAVIGGGYFLYTNFSQAQAARATTDGLETQAIAKGELVVTIDAIGQVRPRQTAQLYWKTSGTVETVAVQAGDQVKAGDKLATLAQTSLPQSVILAQADIFNAQQSLDDLYTNADMARVKAMQDIVTYEQAVRDAQYQLDNFTVPTDQANMNAVEAVKIMKEKLDQARLDFEPYKFKPSGDATRERLKEALDEAQSDYDTAIKRLKYEYNLEVAEANLKQAQDDYAKWVNGPDPAEVEALKAKIAAAEATLSQAWIEAPFDGTVTQAEPQPGDQVSNNSLGFRIDDLSARYVDLSVSEIDINHVETGQPVSLTLDAIRNKEYHGKVVEVAAVGSQDSNVVNFTVTVELTDADADVRPGMTSDVKIVVAQKQDVVLVPNQAIRLENGKQVVYVLQPDQSTIAVPVTIGMSSDTFSELLAGDLPVGAQVVLNPASQTTTTDDLPRGPFRMMTGGGGEQQPAGGQP
ncbi:MAG: efflux RND transporter periplasmic adaptor subunit [Chloroflexota bacterium]